MKRIMTIMAVVVMMLMPVMGAEAHEVYGNVGFREVVAEIEDWDIDDEYEEHITSSQTRVDYEQEEYAREIYFDDDCEVEYACIAAHTWTEYGNEGNGEVWLYVVFRDGHVEEESYDYDTFAEEYHVWGSEE